MAIKTIKSFCLRNNGGFVAKIQVGYITEDLKRKIVDEKSVDITLGKSLTVDIGSYGIKDGQTCFMRAFVVSGNDKDSEESFIYSSSSKATATYTITGTTLISHLRFDGVND